MTDLDQEIRDRYLNQLDEPTWDDEDPRLSFGSLALPYFVAAFDIETSSSRRARLVRVPWQFRDPAALPILARALRDPSGEVWKDALDGIVVLGGAQAREILTRERAMVPANSAQFDKLEWINEALTQLP